MLSSMKLLRLYLHVRQSAELISRPFLRQGSHPQTRTTHTTRLDLSLLRASGLNDASTNSGPCFIELTLGSQLVNRDIHIVYRNSYAVS
jgi:hypothetical protein